MKILYILGIILICVVLYSFADQFLKENLPNDFWLVDKEQSAQSSKPLLDSLSDSKTSSNSNNSNNYPENTNPDNSSSNNSSSNDKEPVKPTISPYYGLAEIQRVEKQNSYNVSLISLRVNPRKGENIDITGWTVKTKRGQAVIPQAMEYYQSYYLPGDIIIKESNTVYLIGAKSPLNSDRNFRSNTCFGYLSKSRNFYPSIYSYCPSPKLEEVYDLNPYCQDFLLHSYGCKMPDYASDFKVSTDSECVEYILDYFTYSGCFEKYSQKDNFLNDYWYVYLNTDIIEPLHDVIYLYDQNGLLIDEYLY